MINVFRFHLSIALSKVKQLSWHNRGRKDDGRTKSLLLQDSSKMEGATETTSLTDLRIPSINSDENDESSRNKIITSASMGDINEVDSGMPLIIQSTQYNR